MGIMDFLKNNKKLENTTTTNEGKTAEIRLVFVKMHEYKSQDFGYLDKHYYISYCLKAPEGIGIEDACTIVSHATNLILNSNHEMSIEKGIDNINNILVTEYGFTPTHPEQYNGYFTITQGYDKFRTIATTICKPIEGVTDLFIVGGNKEIFKRSPLGQRFFEWYNQNTSKEAIEKIYNDYQMQLDTHNQMFLPDKEQ